MAEKKTQSNSSSTKKTTTKITAKTTTAKKTATAKTTATKSTATKKTTATKKPTTKTAAAPVKEEKQSAQTSAGAKEATQNNKVRVILIAALAFLVVLAIVIGIIVGASSCNSVNSDGRLSDVKIQVPSNGVYLLGSGVKPNSEYAEVSAGKEQFFDLPDDGNRNYDTQFSTNTKAGVYGEVLGEVERNIPALTRDEGLSVYPQYGYTLSTVIGTGKAQIAARNALIYEASYLTSADTWNGGAGGYTWMDENGFLYSGTTEEPVPVLDKSGHHRRLYKHTASIGLYGGDVSNSEKAIIKRVTMSPRGYNGYGVTGVYAPAGEVIKITVCAQDMSATGGITVHIGQALYNGKANNIWTDKNQMQRLPILLNTMNVTPQTSVYDEETDTYTAYVGSFVGGPLYIRNANATFTATISGGVAYSHFILGYTTEEEFAENSKSTAPYFDLEVWDLGVLHSGPKRQAANFDYEDIYKAAVLWDKVASVTTTNSAQGIVFIYDPFVAAGAAVAFPGQRSVNCPEGWMTNSLNYNTVVTSGAWGNFHEYHHNFQGYGVGDGGEVTNNGMTLVSYALFTKISANRGITNYGAQGLGGWNDYTSASWALNETLKISNGIEPGNGNKGLALYATLLHNFGPDNYIKAKVKQQQTKEYGENYLGYMQSWQDITHNDMSYYFKDILKGITAAEATQYGKSNYPAFVPVSSVYQVGRSYTYDGEKRSFTTMQPYVIPVSESFDIDLSPYTVKDGTYVSGSVVIPNGFTYKIKSFSNPANGTVTKVDDGHLTYKPANASAGARSGQIVVTLEITKTDGAFQVADVDLILEFEMTDEFNKMTLERTTYFYEADSMYTDAQTAYENNFAGFTKSEKNDHSNPTQNSNTDIWFWPDNEANRNRAEHEWYIVRNNTIDLIEGKLYAEETGKYRIYLRGRLNCAVYYSLDGQNFTLGATIKDASEINNSAYFRNDENTYFDLELEENSWIYFKEVLIVQSYGNDRASYIGLGMKKWDKTQYNISMDHFNSNGQAVENEEAEDYEYTLSTYKFSGTTYAVEEVHLDGALNKFQINKGNGLETVTEAEFKEFVETPVVTNNQQPYVNGYRNDYEFPENSAFETDYYYKRTYAYDYKNNYQLGVGEQRVVEEQCANLNLWTRYGVSLDKLTDVLFNGVWNINNNDQLHTQDSISISEENPFTLVVDLGAEYTANRLVIYSQAGRNDPRFPKALKIYSSLDGNDYKLVKSYTDLTYSGAQQTLDFDDTLMRYYKIEISQSTHNKNAIILRELEMWKVFEINDGNQLAPDDGRFEYGGNWQGVQTMSSFGHIYKGSAGATMTFTFEGTRVGFLSSAVYGKDFEVWIDNQKVESIELKEDNGRYLLTYLCAALGSGTHKVEFRCTGEATIDSIVTFS